MNRAPLAALALILAAPAVAALRGEELIRFFDRPEHSLRVLYASELGAGDVAALGAAFDAWRYLDSAALPPLLAAKDPRPDQTRLIAAEARLWQTQADSIGRMRRLLARSHRAEAALHGAGLARAAGGFRFDGGQTEREEHPAPVQAMTFMAGRGRQVGGGRSRSIGLWAHVPVAPLGEPGLSPWGSIGIDVGAMLTEVRYPDQVATFFEPGGVVAEERTVTNQLNVLEAGGAGYRAPLLWRLNLEAGARAVYYYSNQPREERTLTRRRGEQVLEVSSLELITGKDPGLTLAPYGAVNISLHPRLALRVEALSVRPGQATDGWRAAGSSARIGLVIGGSNR